MVDASLLVATLVPEDQTETARAVLGDADHVFSAPMHLWSETANALLMKQRRGLIDGTYRRSAMARLMDYQIATDDVSSRPMAMNGAGDLAETLGLTVYDALYLELALRRGASLGSLDKALRAACLIKGVPVLPA